MKDELILIVEDNDDDVIIIKRGFKKGKIGNKLHRVTNGQEALDFLENENNLLKTRLILLDLNMEIMNGFEFLMHRMNSAELKKIPVVVLTSSKRHEDVERAYELCANSYVEKPLEPKIFIEAILSIENFWIYFSEKP
jgi:CheY-like chemotaxis protein